jgi:hypothetical protein
MQDAEERPDEPSIPLLEDVVDPEELDFLAIPKEELPQQSSDHQIIIQTLREGIAAQLTKELQPIVATAVQNAVDQVTAQTRQLLLDELHGSLENHIRLLIQAALDQEFKQHP